MCICEYVIDMSLCHLQLDQSIGEQVSILMLTAQLRSARHDGMSNDIAKIHGIQKDQQDREDMRLILPIE